MGRRLPDRLRKDEHIRLSARTFDDPDIACHHPMAQLLYVRMACKSRLLHSDGLVREVTVVGIGLPGWKRHLAALTRAGLLVEGRDEGGKWWLIRGYANWNKLELDYERDEHLGRDGGCKRNHPQPCHRPPCVASREWLAARPEVAPLVGGPVAPLVGGPVAPLVGGPVAPPVPDTDTDTDTDKYLSTYRSDCDLGIDLEKPNALHCIDYESDARERTAAGAR
jgi:hypothetical protein